jgi:hypothetical protein
MCDMISFFIDALDLHRAFWYDLYFSSVWHQVHGAIIVKLQLVSHNLSNLPYHITRPLQNKVRRFYFIFCMFYVAYRDFAQEPFLTYEHETTRLINILLL